MRVHRVDTANAGHLFLVRLFTFLAMGADWFFLGGRTIGTPLLSSVTTKNSASSEALDRRLRLVKLEDGFGHLLVVALEACPPTVSAARWR